MSNVLAQDVCRVLGSINLVEFEDTCSDGFTDAMVGKDVVALGQLGVGQGGTGNDRLIVPKHVAVQDRDTKVPEGHPEVNDLIRTNPGSHKLRAIGCCLDSGLMLRVPVNWGSIDKVKETSHSSSCLKIMEQVGILVSCSNNGIAKGLKSILRDEFLDLAIDCVHPVMGLLR